MVVGIRDTFAVGCGATGDVAIGAGRAGANPIFKDGCSDERGGSVVVAGNWGRLGVNPAGEMSDVTPISFGARISTFIGVFDFGIPAVDSVA